MPYTTAPHQHFDKRIISEHQTINSVTIRTMLEDLGVEANNEKDEMNQVWPLPNIDSEVLRKV